MLMSCYLDVPTFARGAPGVETASLVGGASTLATSFASGVTAITVSSGASFAAGPAWICDGPNSELVAIASVSGAVLTLAAGLGASHAAGVSIATPGVAGALADVLARASSWVESYCGQGRPGAATDPTLFALARVETLRLPGPMAALDPSGVLTVRPPHFPVQTVSALALDWGQGVTWSLDPTQIKLPSFARSFDVPAPLPLPGSLPGAPGLPRTWETLIRGRAGPLWVNLTYVAGLPAASLPWDFVQAVAWVACHLLGVRENPTGAAERHIGKKQLINRQRGDRDDTSFWLASARTALEPYRNRAL